MPTRPPAPRGCEPNTSIGLRTAVQPPDNDGDGAVASSASTRPTGPVVPTEPPVAGAPPTGRPLQNTTGPGATGPWAGVGKGVPATTPGGPSGPMPCALSSRPA